MDIESIVTGGVYAGPLAKTATYTDASGHVRQVAALLDMSPEVQLAAAELGVRGVAVAVRVRVSELAAPVCGDRLTVAGVAYCVDAVDRLNLAEWVLYVTA